MHRCNIVVHARLPGGFQSRASRDGSQSALLRNGSVFYHFIFVIVNLEGTEPFVDRRRMIWYCHTYYVGDASPYSEAHAVVCGHGCVECPLPCVGTCHRREPYPQASSDRT